MSRKQKVHYHHYGEGKSEPMKLFTLENLSEPTGGRKVFFFLELLSGTHVRGNYFLYRGEQACLKMKCRKESSIKNKKYSLFPNTYGISK